MFQDMNKVVMGGALMFVFMVLVLSKFGWIELRVSTITIPAKVNCFDIQLGMIAIVRIYFPPAFAMQHGPDEHWNVVCIGNWIVFISWHFVWSCAHVTAIFIDGIGH